MHENEGFRHLPSEENLIRVLESLRKRFKVRDRERVRERFREVKKAGKIERK